MPKLLLFAPCRQIIIDQHNNPTLVSILQEWSPDKVDIPENAMALYQWEIFALWYRSPEDTDKDFVQTCELIGPSGQKVLVTDLEFRMTATTHRNTMTVLGLPINPGRYDLALYLSQKGAEKERELLTTFPLLAKPADPTP